MQLISHQRTRVGDQLSLAEKKALTPEQTLVHAQKFSEAYTARGPYKLFPEPGIVTEVQKGLAANEVANGYRYCP